MQIKKQSKGLGDSIEKFTKATGIKTVAEVVAKLAGLEGCGCEERKQYLNELFPYSKFRYFEIIENIKINGIEYKQKEIHKVDKDHHLSDHVISLVEQGLIKEIFK